MIDMYFNPPKCMYQCLTIGMPILNVHVCTSSAFKLINHDCLPILMLLNIMLYIVLAYLMLFVCIMLLF